MHDMCTHHAQSLTSVHNVCCSYAYDLYFHNRLCTALCFYANILVMLAQQSPTQSYSISYDYITVNVIYC